MALVTVNLCMELSKRVSAQNNIKMMTECTSNFINGCVYVCMLTRTVRIWDYTQDACINVLSGHTAPVRGLMWNTEVPYLLTSGSWDYTIRVWDTRDGTCLDTVFDHGADVYGSVLNVYAAGNDAVILYALFFNEMAYLIDYILNIVISRNS